MENYYKKLGLKSDATLDEVDKRYNKLLKEFDPNNQSEDLKEFFTSETEKIKDAYEKISASLLNTGSVEQEDDTDSTPNSNDMSDEIDEEASKLADQMVNENKINEPLNDGVKIIAFCFPIIGAILYFVHHKSPQKSKDACHAALWGVGVGIVLNIISAIIQGSL